MNKLITGLFREGKIEMVRSALRKFKRFLLNKLSMKKRISKEDKQILDMVRECKTVYKNKLQRAKGAKRGKINALSICYSYAKGRMEPLFRNLRLNFHFTQFASEIKLEGYQPCKNRQSNRTDIENKKPQKPRVILDNSAVQQEFC